MLSFRQYLDELERKGAAVNLMFESWIYAHISILRKVVDFLSSETIPYALIGGSAVALHVATKDRDEIIPTQDLDLIVNRSDLQKINDSAPKHGFKFRNAAGMDMLLFGGETKAIKGVHLVFSGEKVRPSYIMTAPHIHPDHMAVEGLAVAVIPLPDLVTMKLTSNRDKDRVHIRNMDSVGLITPDIEAHLPTVLKDRLKNIRETE